MSYTDLAKSLSDIVAAGNNVLVYTKPEILDFTNNDSSITQEIYICGMGGNEVSVLFTPNNYILITSLLKNSIFASGMKVFGWNIKSLFSFLKIKTTKELNFECTFLDLKVVENYLGIKNTCPKTLLEALNRLKVLIKNESWKSIQDVYNKIHVPLFREVIPKLETIGILNTEESKKVYAYYEIFGQKNGRLNSSLAFQSGYLPQHLSPEMKKNLKPNDLEDLFMYFDYKNMEVSVLHWLSKDELLGEYLSKNDFYLEIYQLITGNPHNSDKENRIKGKKMFLPIIYGQSPQSLGNRLNVSLGVAEQITERVKTLFSTAVEYVSKYHLHAKENGFCVDIFGKRREFSKDESYEALCFAVQSPASLMCLEKLINLSRVVDIAYSVHDGYCVYSNKKHWKQVYKSCHDVLISDSSLFPGLKLKVSCYGGRNLESLKPLLK